MFLRALFRVSVFVAVCDTITKKIADRFVPNFMGRFLVRKGKTKLVFLYDQ